MRRACVAILIALGLTCIWPAAARADVGVGLRMAWVKPNVDVEPKPDARRFTGAQLRARLSPRTGIELSYDWRTEENETKTVRTQERPFQGTLLINLMSGGFSPYLLGGIGWYSSKIETLGGSNDVIDTVSDTTFGYHAGFGAEIRAGKHAGIHADYRYKFIRNSDETNAGSSIPVIGAITEKLGLSKNGSMWTAGVTLYF